jgi:hypothetical protein
MFQVRAWLSGSGGRGADAVEMGGGGEIGGGASVWLSGMGFLSTRWFVNTAIQGGAQLKIWMNNKK